MLNTPTPWNPKSNPRTFKGHSLSYSYFRSTVSPDSPTTSWHISHHVFNIPLYSSILPHSYTLYSCDPNYIPQRQLPFIARKLFKLHQHLFSYLIDTPSPPQSQSLQLINSLLCSWLSSKPPQQSTNTTPAKQRTHPISTRIEYLRQQLKLTTTQENKAHHLIAFLITQLQLSWTTSLHQHLFSHTPPSYNTFGVYSSRTPYDPTKIPAIDRPPTYISRVPLQQPFPPVSPADFSQHLSSCLQKHPHNGRLINPPPLPPIFQLLQLSRIIAFQLVSTPQSLHIYSNYLPRTPQLSASEPITPIPAADSFATHWLASFCPSLARFLSKPLYLPPEILQ